MSVQELASTKKDAGETVQAASKAAGAKQESAKAPWAPKEMATLIKAVKLFPGGTLDRWAKIAEYVNEHGGDEGESASAKATRQRSAKECIATSKTVQQAASADRAKLQASVQKPVPKVDVKDAPTVRLTDSKMGTEQTKENKTPAAAADKNAGSPSTMMAPLNASWNADQQMALENGLRTFPAAAFRSNPNERWAKIAETIQGKSVKEVKNRVKELAELAKTKKK
jgi:DnaJ family protein C protein 2